MSRPSATFEPAASRTQRAERLLRFGILLQCTTLAWLALFHGTPLDTLLFMELGAEEELARQADRLLAASVLLGALGLAVHPRGALGAGSATLVGVAFLVVAVATRIIGGRAFSELAPLSHAVRWSAPLALFWLANDARPARGAWVLRIGVAATFLAHGWQAIQAYPGFVDLMMGTARRWLDAAPTEATIRALLVGIGIVDFAVALLLIGTRWPKAALWAGLWGVITALSRTVAFGTEFTFESTLRSLNGLAPFALWLLWSNARAARPPTAAEETS